MLHGGIRSGMKENTVFKTKLVINDDDVANVFGNDRSAIMSRIHHV